MRALDRICLCADSRDHTALVSRLATGGQTAHSVLIGFEQAEAPKNNALTRQKKE